VPNDPFFQIRMNYIVFLTKDKTRFNKNADFQKILLVHKKTAIWISQNLIFCIIELCLFKFWNKQAMKHYILCLLNFKTSIITKPLQTWNDTFGYPVCHGWLKWAKSFVRQMLKLKSLLVQGKVEYANTGIFIQYFGT